MGEAARDSVHAGNALDRVSMPHAGGTEQKRSLPRLGALREQRPPLPCGRRCGGCDAALSHGMTEADLFEEAELRLLSAAQLDHGVGGSWVERAAESERCQYVGDERSPRGIRLRDRETRDARLQECRRRHLGAREGAQERRSRPDRRVEQPRQGPTAPALLSDRTADARKAIVESPGVDADVDLRPQRRTTAATVDARRDPERGEVANERWHVLFDRRVDRDPLAVARQVPVAAEVAEHAEQRWLVEVRLVRRPDEWDAENGVAFHERARLAPAAPRQHAVIVGHRQPASVDEDQLADGPRASIDSAAVRIDAAEAPAVEAADSVCGRHGLDRADETVRRPHAGPGPEATYVEPNARRRDVALVRDAAADRLRVARVVVGAEDAVLGFARLHAALQLLEAALVDGAERLDVHGCFDCRQEPPAPAPTMGPARSFSTVSASSASSPSADAVLIPANSSSSQRRRIRWRSASSTWPPQAPYSRRTAAANASPRCSCRARSDAGSPTAAFSQSTTPTTRPAARSTSTLPYQRSPWRTVGANRSISSSASKSRAHRRTVSYSPAARRSRRTGRTSRHRPANQSPTRSRAGSPASCASSSGSPCSVTRKPARSAAIRSSRAPAGPGDNGSPASLREPIAPDGKAAPGPDPH